ncbi:ABC transporter substrate-binding protein [Kamptonema cortianum]|nr:ABC transporter substrate-binding protein [Geitlerinema splendidum]MDK3161051.1 ABC transporter substrate-binding protein [Kamptonema cortianum]
MRTLTAIVAGFIGLAMVACSSGGGESAANSESGGSAEAKKPKIAISIPTATHGWTAGIVYWANEAAKEFASDADFTIVTAESGEDQGKKLETLAAQGFDGLVVLSFEPSLVTPVIKGNRDSFGYIVSVDRGLTEPIADVWLRGDNKEFGKKAAEFMASRMPNGGNILVFRGIASPIDNDRVEGFQGVMKNHPNIKILDMQHGNWDRDTAYKLAQNLLVKYPKVDAIWASDDDMALGIEKALKEAGRDKGMWMLGGAGMKDVVKRVMDGDSMFPGNVTYSPRMIYDAVQKCVEDLKAGKKPGSTQVDIVLPIEVITPDNAKDYYYPDAAY